MFKVNLNFQINKIIINKGNEANKVYINKQKLDFNRSI